jgi:NADH dehydrogenase FAD-containing subunit
VDPAARTVRMRAASPPADKEETACRAAAVAETTLSYDALVIAVGARSATFGVPGVRAHALFLKELSDARAIRQRVIANVEASCFPGVPPAERARLRAFVIVGGGPSGVELAAELHDFLAADVARLYGHGVAAEARITIVEAGRGGILSSFDASLREYARAKFARDAMEVRAGVAVTAVGARGVTLSDGREMPCGLVVWNTGIRAQPLVAALDGVHFRKDKWGHLVTTRRLEVLRPPSSTEAEEEEDDDDAKPSSRSSSVLRGVFCIGDAAAVGGGARYAATAQVAEQQGDYLGRAFNAAADAAAADNLKLSKLAPAAARRAALRDAVCARRPPAPFVYRHRGSLAMLGMFAGIADFSAVRGDNREAVVAPLLRGVKLRGAAAWLLWRSAYLTKLGRWRNRLQVPADWARVALFGRDVTQF